MARTKKDNTPKTYDDHVALARERYYDHERLRSPIPEPTYTYAIGEAITYGNRPDARVEDVLDGGKTLHISVADRGEHYGVPYDSGQRVPIFIRWHEVQPTAGVLPTRLASDRRQANYSQTSIDSLISTAYSRGLNDSPTYQRDYVWSDADKQRLLRSIFDGADIGKFVFLSHEDANDWRLEVVDGKQRLRTIMDFQEGRIAYDGILWRQLSRADRWAFDGHMVQSITLNASRTKVSDVLWLFLSINRGGVPQTDAQVAKVQALYDAAVAAGQ